MTSRKSFDGIKNWVESINIKSSKETPCILAGNNIDLLDQRKVGVEEGYNLAKSLGFKYHELSAKDNIGLDEAF